MVASKMVAFGLSHFTDFEHVKIINSPFADFEQKYLVVIFLTLNKSKLLIVALNNNYRFMNFLVITFILYKEEK